MIFKKIIASLLLISMVIAMAACSALVPTHPTITESSIEETEPVISYTESSIEETEQLFSYISFSDYMEELNESRREMLAYSEDAFEGYDEYFPLDRTFNDILTEEEIKSLKTEKECDLFTRISLEEAKRDVDVYIRALKYGYGGYLYFGGDEKFEKVRQELYTALDSMESVYVFTLYRMLVDSFSFVDDSHFTINSTVPSPNLTGSYQYYYTDEIYFSLDDNGYYTIINDEKWYYDQSFDDSVQIKCVLDSNGNLVYSPIRFSKLNGVLVASSILLKNGEKIKYKSILWKKSENFGSTSDTGYHSYAMNKDIAYVTIREFPGSNSVEQLGFLYSGVEARNAKAVIIDLRSNSGGSVSHKEWVKNFKAIHAFNNKSAEGTLATLFTNKRMKYGKEYLSRSVIDRCDQIPNDTPVFLLVDRNTASAAEMFLAELQVMENVMIVGATTSGCVICGGVKNYYLPNSGIRIRFGCQLYFFYDMTNIDTIGFEPDVWCDPKYSLTYVLKLIENEELVSKEEIDALRNALKEYGIEK